MELIIQDPLVTIDRAGPEDGYRRGGRPCLGWSARRRSPGPISAILLALVVCGPGPLMASVGPAMPTPPAVPPGDLAIILPTPLATARRVQDLERTIDHDQAAKTASPFGLLDEVLQQKPLTANLAPGPLVLVIHGDPLHVALVVSAVHPKEFVDLAAANNLPSQTLGSLVIVADDPQGLALGQAMAALYPVLAADGDVSDIRLSIPGVTVRSYARSKEASPPLIGMCKEIGSVLVDLTIGTEGVRVNACLSAVAGSHLAAALTTPGASGPVASVDPEARNVTGRLDGHEDLKALGDYLAFGLGEVTSGRRPGLKDDRPERIRVFAGHLAGAVDAGLHALGTPRPSAPPDGPRWMEVDGPLTAVLGTDDADQVRASFIGLVTDPAWTRLDGPFTVSHTTITVEPHARAIRRVDGTTVQIDQLTIREDGSDASGYIDPHPTRIHWEFAAIGHRFILAGDDAGLDALVAPHGPGAPAATPSAIGSGRQIAITCPLHALLGLVDRSWRGFPGVSDPITMAWTARDGQGLLEILVPVPSLRNLADGRRAR